MSKILLKFQNKNGSGSYSFSESNYNAGLCGKGHTLSSDIPQGSSAYDAARRNMGEPWMMFTYVQGRELINNTIHEWTSINGVNGRKYTSKSDTSKYIFFPAGGGWSGTTNSSKTSYGNYWCSSRYSPIYAWYLYFADGGIAESSNWPWQGLSIRPIAPPKPW